MKSCSRSLESRGRLPEVVESRGGCGTTSNAIEEIRIAGIAGDQLRSGESFMLLHLCERAFTSKNQLLTTIAWKIAYGWRRRAMAEPRASDHTYFGRNRSIGPVRSRPWRRIPCTGIFWTRWGHCLHTSCPIEGKGSSDWDTYGFQSLPL